MLSPLKRERCLSVISVVARKRVNCSRWKCHQDAGKPRCGTVCGTVPWHHGSTTSEGHESDEGGVCGRHRMQQQQRGGSRWCRIHTELTTTAATPPPSSSPSTFFGSFVFTTLELIWTSTKFSLTIYGLWKTQA